MGLDSATSAYFIVELEEWVGVELEPELVFDYPTIDELARHIVARGSARMAATRRDETAFRPREAPASSPRSPICCVTARRATPDDPAYIELSDRGQEVARLTFAELARRRRRWRGRSRIAPGRVTAPCWSARTASALWSGFSPACWPGSRRCRSWCRAATAPATPAPASSPTARRSRPRPARADRRRARRSGCALRECRPRRDRYPISGGGRRRNRAPDRRRAATEAASPSRTTSRFCNTPPARPRRRRG